MIAPGVADAAGARPELSTLDLHLVDGDVASQVLHTPASVTGSDRGAEVAGRVPTSLLRVLTPGHPDSATRGRVAGGLIRELIRTGHYRHFSQAMAVHELRSTDRRQLGIIAGIPLAAIRAGVVRPHEQTREDRQQRLAAFLDAVGADVDPVLVSHPAHADFDAVVSGVTAQQPTLTFSGSTDSTGVSHRVWIIQDPVVCERLRIAARSIEQLTIIDGHHRAAAALHARTVGGGSGNVGDPDRVLLAELVADRDLVMTGFDRRLRVRDPVEANEILQGLSAVAELIELGSEPPPRPTGPQEMLVGLPGRWVRATFADPPADLPASLPVCQLQARVLDPIIGIRDPRTDPRLENVPGCGDLSSLDRSLRAAPGIAFVPRAVTMKELQEVARLGGVLPPKSTYVDPKAGPGLVLRLRPRTLEASSRSSKSRHREN